MGPLLETKLHMPRRRRALVARPRLSERLDGADDPRLVLVSAPAGFGKTTLLTEWLDPDASGRRVAWLSLDQRDNDPTLFWAYLVAALRTAVPGVGAGALALLQSPPTSTDAVLATLLDDLSVVPDGVVLVLDDFHVIESADVQDGVAFLLDHLPARMQLAIATRSDPALPLARLRARGELVEVRAGDLRFSADEAVAYLNGTMGLAITARDVAVLEERTEGWIAALQLAALSMQGRDDVGGFIAGFAGDDRFVVDYLVEEVLQRQPPLVRDFLLRTSILSRLTGSLCDAVTGGNGGKATLEDLERLNLFLIPLDDRRRWYRYHHLFADVLRARLLDEHPDDVRAHHLRASDWYERNGESDEAISHALAAADAERAADLIERALPALNRGRQEVTIRRWLDALPVELFAVRPVLSNGYAGALMSTGVIDGVDARLSDAERWLDPSAGTATGMVVVDEEGFRRLPGGVALHRTGLALLHGDLAGTVEHAHRTLHLADPEDHLVRGGATALLGLASWTTGDLEAAHRWYAEGMVALERAGHRADVVGGAITLGDIRIAQGRLRDARGYYERGLQAATEQPGAVLRGAADMHVGLGELCREGNDLDGALRHLRSSADLGEHNGLPQNRYRWRVAMARLRQIAGDSAAALDLLAEAERVHTSDFSPQVRPIPAIRARLWLAQGRLDDSRAWVRDRSLTVDDDLDYLREFEHVTLARVLLAGQQPTDALRLLERLLHAADDGGRLGTVIEVLVLQALAHQANGDVRGALGALRRAVELAAPEGYVRIFVDEGPPMAALLRAMVRQQNSPPAVRRLLADVDTTAGVPTAHQGLVDPLSARELDVLRLLGSHLDGPDIARELFVSLNTVRTHTKNIYAKLGVNSRRAAVRRGEELDLLSRAGRPVVRDR